MLKKQVLLLLFILALLLSGCEVSSAPEEDYAPAEAQRLVVYTSHKEEVYLPIIREFEERTGIWVEVVTGGTNELLEAVRSGKAAGADIMFGGGVESLENSKEYFSPYRCDARESLNSDYCSDSDYWTPFSALPIVLVYNTKLVSQAELCGWEDLLSDRFTGRIAYTDPSRSGSCYTSLVTLLYASEQTEEETLRRFSEALAGQQLQSSGAVLAAVEDGTALVGITLEETAMKRIATGSNLAIVYPLEGTGCVPDGSAIMKGAAHPENAALFMDFIVSVDVQQLLAAEQYRRPVRNDVENIGPLPALDELTLVEYDVIFAAENQNRLLEHWAAMIEEAGR